MERNESSLLVNFYRGKSVFITGATGFLGKVLVEKLIRTCTGINKVYILLRSKNGISTQQRLDEFLSSKCFDYCNKATLTSKVIAIDGDVTLPLLGISDKDINTLKNDVSVVFHSAASVRFDEPLKDCLKYNVLATKLVLELCHEIKNLKAFIHVSTAYAYCNLPETDEVLYPMKASANRLLEAAKWMDEDTLQVVGERLFEGRPNTYTFTKALAEHYINENKGQLPVAIVRPSIITATSKEPIPGWIDSINGPAGACLLGALGIARTMNFHPYKIGDFIPVDIVSNAAIAAAWQTATKNETELKVYNVTSGNVNPLTWKQFLEYGREMAVKYPSYKTIRPPAHVLQKKKVNLLSHYATKYFSEIFFAYFLDMFLILIGQKPIMVKVVNKMHNAFNLLEFFAQRQWSFPCNNLLAMYNSLPPKDRELFPMNVREVNWHAYSHDFYMGIRRHLLKEDDSNIEKARRWVKKFVRLILI
ncbi:fatty acyl-CoA reductase CG5065-like protein [Dinothrombium tinctorium]|uniref:Fatty acyl-CoA reductase n=1 Tax=Dinothrombium tinctorium TaxID=1965070 RepID=A0A443QLB0_9ACAR|nr:fatty acyl-CoA reductase CG5065-like protein [Dinothrombium tinctorium]RWS03810.1 fatty acyl-CoA reductase CG5065-like protein [Dinothrombium tinctorium]